MTLNHIIHDPEQLMYCCFSLTADNEHTPGFTPHGDKTYSKPRRSAFSLLSSCKTALHCIQIKAGKRYETARLGSRRRSRHAASLQTEGVTHSGDGEAILSFWKGTLAAAALSAFIIIRHYSLAICSDLGKWF